MALPVSLACLVLLCGLLLQQCLHRHRINWITESGACMILGFLFNALIIIMIMMIMMIPIVMIIIMIKS